MSYKVLVKDFVHGIILIEEIYDDANVAYKEYRIACDSFDEEDNVIIELVEPDD